MPTRQTISCKKEYVFLQVLQIILRLIGEFTQHLFWGENYHYMYMVCGQVEISVQMALASSQGLDEPALISTGSSKPFLLAYITQI